MVSMPKETETDFQAEEILGQNNLDDLTKQGMVPHPHLSEVGESEHIVQFCETDEFLINSVSEFIGAGLRAGDACIIIATKPHVKSFRERLEQEGLDVAAAEVEGQYVALDADTVLSQIMIDGFLSSERFVEVVEKIIARVAKGWRHVRIFGEMVALLWEKGNRAAMIRLEELWNDLNMHYPFSLLCGYSMRSFSREESRGEFTEICMLHSRIIPGESYILLPSLEERLRAIALLQQRASSLEAEVALRKSAEEALLYQAAILESSDDAIISKDLEGIITGWNPAAERIYGYRAEEVVGRPITLLFAPDRQDEFTQIMSSIRRGERVSHYETVRVRKDGTYLTVSITVSPIKNSTGAIIGASAIARDMTEQKRLQDELKELDLRKDEFVSMASHELKTPLTSLKGFTQILMRRLEKQGMQEPVGILVRMEKQINRLTKLVDDLLDLSKIQAGQLDYAEDTIALDELIHATVDILQLTSNGHTITVHGASHADVRGDCDRLEQVFLNLINNAIKYSPQADSVEVHIASSKDEVLVKVRDFGIGIPKEYESKVFERFYRVPDKNNKTLSGLGMGLYICREIVERHGGKIWLESSEGEGSTFFVSLPIFRQIDHP